MVHGLLARLRSAQERFWVLPALVILAAVVCGVLLPRADPHVTLPEAIAFSGEEATARSVLGAIVTASVSTAGVSFSVIVVALVLSAQQLSPRVLRSFQRRPLNQAVLGLLLGTATYALFVLGAVGDDPDGRMPELSVTGAMVLTTVSLAVFVVFLHHVVRSLNASAVIRRIAAEGHESIAYPYPAGVGDEPEDPAAAEHAAEERRRGAARTVEVRAPRAGYVASVDGAAIVAWARAQDVLVEQRRGVGAFAVTGAVLAVVHGDDGAGGDCGPVAGAFLLNEERLVDGDIAFPLRQLADVALKGLSPGINDPTTAENAMDSVTDTLVRFARRPAVEPLRLDGDRVPRLLAIAPTLDDLVKLGFDQVRRDAARQPTFAVRLLELLADLRASAPAAAAAGEIDRQAALIAEQAAILADHQADQRLVGETYERLHPQARVRTPTGAA